MDTGLLVLRTAFGLGFASHGAWKLGWFGGPGIRGAAGGFEALGFRPGRLVVALLGITEIAAGLLLAGGFLTPLAGAVIIGVTLNAIVLVKLKDGLIGGYELEALYLVAGLALAFVGPGAYSLDAVIGWDFAGTEWGIGALALGVVTGVLTMASRRPAKQAIAEAERRAA